MVQLPPRDPGPGENEPGLEVRREPGPAPVMKGRHLSCLACLSQETAQGNNLVNGFCIWAGLRAAPEGAGSW